MSTENNYSYDQLPYPSYVFRQTHPNSLATLAALFGMKPSPIQTCRVLEIGCGTGFNLIAMAQHYPQANFVGVDLSKHHIEAAKENIIQTGLKNVQFFHKNIMDVDREFGTFDYIIAHGVYSWIPPVVQDKLLQICHDNLSPNGVAYISYNAYPGCYPRDMIRNMMMYHVKNITNVDEKFTQLGKFLSLLLGATGQRNDAYSQTLQSVSNLINRKNKSYVYHDYLEDNNRPCFFHEFVERAKQHQLQYLAEAEITGTRHIYASNLTKQLGNELTAVEQEQYMDFIENRAFRSTLLCHNYVCLERNLVPKAIRQFYLRAAIKAESPEVDLSEGKDESFTNISDQSVVLNHISSLCKAAAVELSVTYPHQLTYDELLKRSYQRLVNAKVIKKVPKSISEQEHRKIGDFLLHYYLLGRIEGRLQPWQVTTTVGKYPCLSPLTRLQIKQGSDVCNSWYEAYILESMNPLAVYLAPYLDGLHNKEALVEKVLQAVNSGKLAIATENVSIAEPEKLYQFTLDSVDTMLTGLAIGGYFISYTEPEIRNSVV